MTKEQFIIECINKGIKQVQINEKLNKENVVRIIDKEVIKYDVSDEISYIIKGNYNDNNISIETNYLDISIVDELLEKGRILEVKYDDVYLSDTSKNNVIETKKVDLSLDKEISKAISLMDIKEKYEFIDKISIYISKEYEKVSITNSNGVNISSDSSINSCYLEILAKDNDKYVQESKNIFFNDVKEIEKLLEEVLTKISNSLYKKKIDSDRYNIILEPRVFNKVIKNIFIMLEGSNIRLKKSILTDKLNIKVFSDKLTVIEEPLNKNMPGYRTFDEEGTFTYNKEIISKGVLNTYLYGNKEALKVNEKSTANFFDTLTRNAYVEKGNLSYNQLLKLMNNGIIITESMGSSNTAIDISNGNISLQIFGFLVENGKIISGIEPSILTTDIFELLNNIEEIGNDLEFNSVSLSTPSVLIKNISITTN